MKDLLELLSVPMSVLALAATLVLVGWIETGAISLTAGYVITAGILLLEFAVYRFYKRRKGGEEPDEENN